MDISRPDVARRKKLRQALYAATAVMVIDLQEAIRAALDLRTDVSRARRQLDINEATVRDLRDSTLPALDLIGSYQSDRSGWPSDRGRRFDTARRASPRIPSDVRNLSARRTLNPTGASSPCPAPTSCVAPSTC